jgi:hypothetical protein
MDGKISQGLVWWKAALLSLVALITIGGSTPIHIDIEPGGDIDLDPPDGIFENAHGAIFWNGSRWVTNDTAAHAYFTDLRTGQKLYPHTVLATLDGSGSPGVVFTHSFLTATQSIYNYTINATDDSGRFLYQAIEYSIDVGVPGDKLILRSRGSGNGTSQGFLDIYIQNKYTYTVAFRSDPIWYEYTDTTAEQAVQFTSDTQGRAGYLPSYTPNERAQYWLDINGGADMGGVTYYFHTSQIAPVGTRNLGSSFPTEFRLMWTDETYGNINEFIVLPRVISETLLPPANNRLHLPLILR